MSKSNRNLDLPKRIKVVGKKKNRFNRFDYNINDIELDMMIDYDSEFTLKQDEENDEKNYIG